MWICPVKDAFGRVINYLRVSVTDRCNLHCVYCRPPGGVPLFAHERILSYEEIVEFVRVAVGYGIDKVRITGGEPLVRRNIVSLVERLAQVPGIADLCMTTNGTVLEQFAIPLAAAGLGRVNVSLDAVASERYAAITRGGDVTLVLAGIDAALEAGLKPVKLNCVVERSLDEPDAREVAAYGAGRGLEVRYIRRMNLSEGTFWVVHGGSGGNCAMCNRLRLTSDGRLRPCLFHDVEFNVRELGYEKALEAAVAAKPKCGSSSPENLMYQIGG